MKTSVIGWVKTSLNAGTILTIVCVGSGLVAAHGRDRQRADDLERRITVIETRGARKADLQDRDREMVEALRAIDGRLTTIERVLMEQRRGE
jgi:hypothetical protein